MNSNMKFRFKKINLNDANVKKDLNQIASIFNRSSNGASLDLGSETSESRCFNTSDVILPASTSPHVTTRFSEILNLSSHVTTTSPNVSSSSFHVITSLPESTVSSSHVINSNHKNNSYFISDFSSSLSDNSSSQTSFLDRPNNLTTNCIRDQSYLKSNPSEQKSNLSEHKSNFSEQKSNFMEQKSNLSEKKINLSEHKSNFSEKKSNLLEQKYNLSKKLSSNVLEPDTDFFNPKGNTCHTLDFELNSSNSSSDKENNYQISNSAIKRNRIQHSEISPTCKCETPVTHKTHTITSGEYQTAKMALRLCDILAPQIAALMDTTIESRRAADCQLRLPVSPRCSRLVSAYNTMRAATTNCLGVIPQQHQHCHDDTILSDCSRVTTNVSNDIVTPGRNHCLDTRLHSGNTIDCNGQNLDLLSSPIHRIGSFQSDPDLVTPVRTTHHSPHFSNATHQSIYQTPSYNSVSSKHINSTPSHDVLNDRKFINDVEDLQAPESINDNSKDAEFLKEHHFMKQAYTLLRSMFGLHEFRLTQKPAVTAALLGHDCFILMPTGGGKSLCYQLPALMHCGVTVVISPLISLIQDQICKLNSLDIPAAHLTASTSGNDSGVFKELSRAEPGVRLLYTTPEMVSASRRLSDAFNSLYKRGKLTRLVIDEAHCVSQWGHDFRPDYKRLNELHRRFPGVPLMVLTATATRRVRHDVLQQLSLNTSRVKWFVSSFNRSNLKYEIIRKKGKVLDSIVAYINGKFARKSGIIYCLSQHDCDKMALDLTQHKIMAASYHAGLSDVQRKFVQNEWLANKAHVICATVAFGMGIDKPDVRFVIHHSLPKSLEGYYQESGRAGRDGLVSECILYYGYHDVNRWHRLLSKSRDNLAAHSVHTANLWQMCRFCENITDCRRTLMLAYFGERFDRRHCVSDKSTACDNCANQVNLVVSDVTNISRSIIKSVQSVSSVARSGDTRMPDNCIKGKYTLLHYVEVFRGSASKKIINIGHNRLEMYSLGRDWSKTDAERLLRHLLLEKYLREELILGGIMMGGANRHGQLDDVVRAYVMPGADAYKLLRSTCDVRVLFHRQSSARVSEGSAGSGDTTQVDTRIRELQQECHQALVEKCHEMALSHDASGNVAVNAHALVAMSQRMPTSRQQMLDITHVTEANFAKFGAHLIAVIEPFAERLARFTSGQSATKGTRKVSGAVTGSAAKRGKRDTRAQRCAEAASKNKPSSAVLGLMPLPVPLCRGGQDRAGPGVESDFR